MSTKSLRLVIDIDVLLDDDESDTSWVLEQVKDDPMKEVILGGYRFHISSIEEAPEEVGSSATETENLYPDVDEVYTPGSGEDDYDEAVQQERERG